MGAIASQITSLTIVYSIVYSVADQRKHQSSASLAFVRGIYRDPVNSPHKWPVTRKMFPFDDVIIDCVQMLSCERDTQCHTTFTAICVYIKTGKIGAEQKDGFRSRNLGGYCPEQAQLQWNSQQPRVETYARISSEQVPSHYSSITAPPLSSYRFVK